MNATQNLTHNVASRNNRPLPVVTTRPTQTDSGLTLPAGHRGRVIHLENQTFFIEFTGLSDLIRLPADSDLIRFTGV